MTVHDPSALAVAEPLDSDTAEATAYSMFDGLPHPVWVLDPTGSPLFSNRTWRQYARAGVGPQHPDAVHPDDLPMVIEGWKAASARAAPVELRYRLRRWDGAFRWHRLSAVVNSGESAPRWVAIGTDIDDLVRAERQQRERTSVPRDSGVDRPHHATLASDVGIALTGSAPLHESLQRCAEALVERLGAAFARIWTYEPDEHVLALRASAGLYVHLDGPHRRVPVGSFKIGLIAQERAPHLTNDVAHDPRIGDPAWAAREGMVAFAGYPLEVDDRLVGVMALFARRPLADDTLDALASVADVVALGIDRKRADEGLRSSEARHRLFVEATNEGLWYWDLRRNTVEWNDRLLAMIGVRRDEWGGTFDDFMSLVHPEDRTRLRAALDAHLESRVPYELEFRLVRHADQSCRVCLTRGKAEWDADGRPTRMAGGVADITEQRDAQLELARFSAEREQLLLREQSAHREAEHERRRLHELFLQAPVPIAVWDGPKHVFVLANAPYETMLGRGDLAGREIREAFPETASSPIFDLFDSVYATGNPCVMQEMPVRIAPQLDEDRWFSFNLQPVRDPFGRITGLIAVAVDVSEQVRARKESEARADQLSRLTRALERSNTELDQFAYVASHDLKAPLRGIANLAQWIQEDLGDRATSEIRDHLALLQGRVHRMESLINGILSYSRAGRVREKVETVDVVHAANEIIELLAPPADATVDVRFPFRSIDTEKVPLEQVFLNLIGNALKHARRAGARIELAAVDAGACWEFSVSDNGPGIAPEYHERIWQIFQTLEARDKVEGTGIGLSVVKKIIETRGGRVWVESTPGNGATFRFTWPKQATEGA